MTERVRGNYDLYHGQTPAQTLGPFFHQGLLRTRDWFQVPGVCQDSVDVIGNVLVREEVEGERVRIEGTVYDGQQDPVVDALIEIWQANAQGRYNHPLDTSERPLDAAFSGFGRAVTDEMGGYCFGSIKPGSVPGPSGSVQAPHLNVIVGARGMARHAFTRIYFEGEAELAGDRVLSLVPPSRRQTLIAKHSGARAGVSSYRFDIHLQGENETVFFEI
jgi:protocatechuate 3,4-dioxygenase alpha subunit